MTDQEKETFQFFKNIFDLHLKTKYPDIDKFNIKQHTKELSTIIPMSYLKELVRHYRIFEKVADRPLNPIREISKFSDNPLNVPLKDISNIEMLLKRLEGGKWLWVNDAAEMMNLLYKKILQSPKGIGRELQLVKGKFRGLGRWPNYALHFIVFFLVTCATRRTGKDCFNEIANFLAEQDISSGGADADNSMTPESVMKTYQRPSDVWEFYDKIMQCFESEFFDGLFKTMDSICKHQIDIPLHLRDNFRKFCIPAMIEFHPCHPRWKETIP